MSNRLILHIGMPKTGTTSLQGFMTENREILKRYGWSYPDLRICGEIDYNYKRNLHTFLPLADFVAEKPEYVLEAMTDLTAELENYNVLLSAEQFYDYNWDNHLLLLKLMKEKYPNIEVVVFFREQMEYVKAWYNQQFKHGVSLDRLPEERVVDHCQYLKRAKQLQEIIGKEGLHIFWYDHIDTISIFLDLLGLTKYIDSFKFRERENKSLNERYTEMMSLWSQMVSSEAYAGMCLQTSSYIAEINKEEKDSCNKSINRLINWVGDHTEDNLILGRDFLGKEQLFSVNRKELKEQIFSETEKDLFKLFALLNQKIIYTNRFLLRNQRKKMAFFGGGAKCRDIIASGCVPDIIIDNDSRLDSVMGIEVTTFSEIEEALKQYAIIITLVDTVDIELQLDIKGLTKGIDYACYRDLLI